MPVDSCVDLERRLLRVTASGPISVQDFYSAISTLIDDERFDPTFNRLWDLRRVSQPISHAELKKVVDLILKVRASLGPARQIALVVSDDVSFGMMTMLSLVVEDGRTQTGVFRDMDEAAGWLEKPDIGEGS